MEKPDIMLNRSLYIIFKNILTENGAYFKYVCNMHNDRLKMRADGKSVPALFLSGGFDWKSSTQGDAYWHNLNRKWKAYLRGVK